MAIPSLAQAGSGVTVGLDTHKDVHVAAAFTTDLGRPLGHLQIPTTRPAIASFSGGRPAWATPCGSASREPAFSGPV
jgi:hypothetical protein